jgi:ADP-ribosylglycohydrolase
MDFTNAQMDRAEGVLLGTAAGDALGAPYEFQTARGPEQEVAMIGGGAFGWEPGEWTDDTSMAIARPAPF